MGDRYGDRYRDDGSDDDYRSTTVRRYKVKSAREDRYENVEPEHDDRSRYSGRPSGDYDFYETRRTVERPRSAFESSHHDDRRSAFYERDIDREYSYGDTDKGRITVYEAKDSDFDDKRSRYSRHDNEIKVERRYEDSYEDSHGHDVDRYRKETEYYTRSSPPPPPVIIRQRQEPQKIVVQEAPPPAPIIVPRQEPGVVVIREKDSHSHRSHSHRDRDRGDEEYYYRHERRGDIGPYRGDRESERDHAMALASFNRHRRRDGSRSDDEDYWVHTRRVVRREERSESPHHKRHLAAGALAGAGITALMTSRANEHGEVQDHRGRKVIAGTALGALGTEAIRRAHSAYGERYRNRSESPGHHHKLKTGLGIAAVALAAAGAAKYYQANKVEKEEARRGRSRKRSASRHSHSRDSWSSRSPSKSRSRRRRSLSTAAKAVLGTAATAGLVKHFRDKSKGRSGSRSRSRSKSRLRTAAEIGGAAAAAGVATKMWKNHKDKKERQSRERELSDDERAFSRRGSRNGRSLSRSRSRSRSRSLARSSHLDSADPELGLVEYGRDPLEPEPSARGYESEAEARRRRRRRRRERNASSEDEGSGAERKRSKSRLRDMAAAGAAAFGIKEFKDRKDAEKGERRSRERRDREVDESRDSPRDRSRNRSRDMSRDRSRDKSRSRRGGDNQGYFDGSPGPSSPPMASGGAYYPPYPPTPNAGPTAGRYAPYPTSSTSNPNDFQGYVPQDYMGYAPPPPGGVPPPAATGPDPTAGGYPAPPPGPTGPPHPPGGSYPPDHVSASPRGRERGSTEDGVNRDKDPAPPQTHKSVSFGPMSPLSSRTMEQHHSSHAEHVAGSIGGGNAAAKATGNHGHGEHEHDFFHHSPSAGGSDAFHRRSSDPSSDRPPSHLNDGGQAVAVSDPQDDIEILPDRFDTEGRPLSGRPLASDRTGGWTTRSGEFARRRQRPGDWGMRGSWHVGGTDPEAVERMAQGMTSALESRRGLLRFIGDVFAGGAGRLEGRSDDDEGWNGGHRWRR